MSTENNLDTVFKNSIKILTDLIAFKAISGEDNNALISYCDNIGIFLQTFVYELNGITTIFHYC